MPIVNKVIFKPICKLNFWRDKYIVHIPRVSDEKRDKILEAIDYIIMDKGSELAGKVIASTITETINQSGAKNVTHIEGDDAAGIPDPVATPYVPATAGVNSNT